MRKGEGNLGSEVVESLPAPADQALPHPTPDSGNLAPRTRSVFVPLLLVFALLAPIPGAFAYHVMQRREDALMKARFNEYLGSQAYSLREKMLAIGESLYSLRSHFHASEEVTRKEFASFTRETRARLQAIRALEWAVRITHEERDAHETSARNAGLFDYGIRSLSVLGALVRAPPAEDYHPVFFVEPREGNEAAFGLDLWSEASRRKALETAIESDQVAFSDPIRLVQCPNSGEGVLAVLSILAPRKDSPRGSDDQVQGFALVVLCMSDLVEWALPADQVSARMHFQLVHEAHEVDGHPDRLLYRPPTTLSERTPPIWTQSLVIETGGQRWRLDAHPTEAFKAQGRDSLPLTLGIAALVAWVLLFGNLYLIARWSRGRELKKRDRIVRSVLSNLGEGVIVADEQGEIQLANGAAEAIIGRLPDGIRIGHLSTILGCYKPDTVTRYPEDELPLTRAMRGERVEDEQIYIRNREVPSGRWLSVSGTPLRDTNQSLQGGVAFIRDITEHKKSEDVLKRLSSAVEQTADVVFITNRGGAIEYVNPAFESTFGYTREESIGRTPRILRSGVHEREHYRKLWNTILAGRVFQSLSINRKKNGELIHTVQTITPMKDSHGRVTHFVSVSKDITERRRREEQEAELRVAALVQHRLFPEQSMKVKGLDLAGAAFPAAATCGDYFDFFRFAEGGVAVAIGDVCGHGLGAALLMAETRAYLRSLLRSRAKFPQAFKVLNQSISDDVESGIFVTLLAAHIDRNDQSLVYASAGHVPGYILDRNGEVRQELPPTGPALGILEDQCCTSSPPILLTPGDMVLLLTDGVTETRAPDGRFFEASGALNLIRKHRAEPASEIVQRLYQGTRRFAQTRPQRDDITMVVCKLEE